MRKEIEVKARVSNLDEIQAKLEELGCVISEPVRQEDAIFINYTGSYDDAQPGANFLRIRKNSGKIIFTIKQPQSNELDCLEREVEISDADEMKEAILLLGYREAIHVIKTRRKTKYNGYEICLDEVEDAGTFIEVEKITEEADADRVQSELIDFLSSLGVSREAVVMNGYDTLVYRARQQK